MHFLLDVNGFVYALSILSLLSWFVSTADQQPVAEQASPSPKLSSSYILGTYIGPSPPFSRSEPLGFLTEPLLGIYLGPSQLTSSYYTKSGDPILLAKVEANQEWRSQVLKRAQEHQKYCLNKDSPNPDPVRGSCEEILPAFMKAMIQITEATSNILNDTYKIGYIVIPHNMIDYEPVLDEVMHGAFPFHHIIVEPRDLLEHDIIRLPRAVQDAYNLTNPDSLGAPWAPNGRIIWDTFRESRLEDVFADQENYILLVNFELDFLELTYICVLRGCDEVPRLRIAFPEFGEEVLWGSESDEQGESVQDYDIPVPLSPQFGSRVGQLSHAISGMERSKFRGQHELLRAVVLMGGASQVAMDAMKYALSDALPYVERWRFKTSICPAFVPSLGAALRVYSEELADRDRFQ